MGEAAVRSAFLEQASACERLGSSFVSQLCRLASANLAPDTRVGQHLLGWKGEPGPSGASVPLRLAGALHGVVLLGIDKDLAAVFPPQQSKPDDRALWRAVETAMAAHADFVLNWLESAPQTNEVRRSVAVYCGLLAVAERFPLPIDLLELGASAGLNLVADQYAHVLAGQTSGNLGCALTLEPTWRGTAPALNAKVVVASRSGCDLNPLNIKSENDLLRLKAYTWPDQRDRLDRLVQAASIAVANLKPGDIVKMDAAAFLDLQLAMPVKGRTRVVFHTIAWQYFAPTTQRQCEAVICAAGDRANAQAPLAWLSMEADGPSDAALDLTLWPGGSKIRLARVDFHGRSINWLQNGTR